MPSLCTSAFLANILLIWPSPLLRALFSATCTAPPRLAGVLAQAEVPRLRREAPARWAQRALVSGLATLRLETEDRPCARHLACCVAYICSVECILSVLQCLCKPVAGLSKVLVQVARRSSYVSFLGRDACSRTTLRRLTSKKHTRGSPSFFFLSGRPNALSLHLRQHLPLKACQICLYAHMLWHPVLDCPLDLQHMSGH